jgi:hypothetical protein
MHVCVGVPAPRVQPRPVHHTETGPSRTPRKQKQTRFRQTDTHKHAHTRTHTDLNQSVIDPINKKVNISETVRYQMQRGGRGGFVRAPVSRCGSSMLDPAMAVGGQGRIREGEPPRGRTDSDRGVREVGTTEHLLGASLQRAPCADDRKRAGGEEKNESPKTQPPNENGSRMRFA